MPTQLNPMPTRMSVFPLWKLFLTYRRKSFGNFPVWDGGKLWLQQDQIPVQPNSKKRFG